MYIFQYSYIVYLSHIVSYYFQNKHINVSYHIQVLYLCIIDGHAVDTWLTLILCGMVKFYKTI